MHPVSLAQIIEESLLTAKHVHKGRILGAASVGGKVQVLLPYPLPKVGRVVDAVALNDCPGGEVTLFKGDAGAWYCLSDKVQQVIQENVVRHRHYRQQRLPIKTTGPIKILFSVISDNNRDFYIGGDRETPSKIFSISADSYYYGGWIYNTGKKQSDWIVCLKYNETIKTFTPGSSWDVTDFKTVELSPLGHGFWSSLGFFSIADTDVFFGGGAWRYLSSETTKIGEGSAHEILTTVYQRNDYPGTLIGNLLTGSGIYKYEKIVGDRAILTTIETSHNFQGNTLSFHAEQGQLFELEDKFIEQMNGMSKYGTGEYLDTRTITINRDAKIQVLPSVIKLSTLRGSIYENDTDSSTIGVGETYTLNFDIVEFEPMICGINRASALIEKDTSSRKANNSPTTQVSETELFLVFADGSQKKVANDTDLNIDLLIDLYYQEHVINLIGTKLYVLYYDDYYNEEYINTTKKDMKVLMYDFGALTLEERLQPNSIEATVLSLKLSPDTEYSIESASFYPN